MHTRTIFTDIADAQKSFGVGVFKAIRCKCQMQECFNRGFVLVLVVNIAELPTWKFYHCFLSLMSDLGFVTTTHFLRGP